MNNKRFKNTENALETCRDAYNIHISENMHGNIEKYYAKMGL